MALAVVVPDEAGVEVAAVVGMATMVASNMIDPVLEVSVEQPIDAAVVWVAVVAEIEEAVVEGTVVVEMDVDVAAVTEVVLSARRKAHTTAWQ